MAAGRHRRRRRVPIPVLQGDEDAVAARRDAGLLRAEALADQRQRGDIQGAGHAMLPDAPDRSAAETGACVRSQVRAL